MASDCAREGAEGRRRRGRRETSAGVAGDRGRKAKADEEPERLGLTQPGEYGLFTILREYSASKDEAYVADCARRMVAHLRSNQLLPPGWSNSIGGRMRVEQSLLAESWNPTYAALGL